MRLYHQRAARVPSAAQAMQPRSDPLAAAANRPPPANLAAHNGLPRRNASWQSQTGAGGLTGSPSPRGGGRRNQPAVAPANACQRQVELPSSAPRLQDWPAASARPATALARRGGSRGNSLAPRGSAATGGFRVGSAPHRSAPQRPATAAKWRLGSDSTRPQPPRPSRCDPPPPAPKARASRADSGAKSYEFSS